jgi:hypothetical protein
VAGDGNVAGGLVVNDPHAVPAIESAAVRDVDFLRGSRRGARGARLSGSAAHQRRDHRRCPSQQQEAFMLEVQRIWRITTSANSAIEVRLSAGRNGDQQLMLERFGSDPADEQTFDVEVARALAQAMLEACEVASALSDQAAATR